VINRDTGNVNHCNIIGAPSRTCQFGFPAGTHVHLDAFEVIAVTGSPACSLFYPGGACDFIIQSNTVITVQGANGLGA
jgi:hypothetical protein